MLDAVRTKELPRLAWAEDKAKAEEAVEAYLERLQEWEWEWGEWEWEWGGDECG